MYQELRNIEIEVPIKFVGNTLGLPKTTLDKLYQKGWWITEIFGSYAVIVAKSTCTTRKSPAPYFKCFHVHLYTPITPKQMQIIKRIQDKQWNKYKKELNG